MLTNSFRKCREISMENLYVDILKLTLRPAFSLHPKLLLDLGRLQYQLQVLLQWRAGPMQKTINT